MLSLPTKVYSQVLFSFRTEHVKMSKSPTLSDLLHAHLRRHDKRTRAAEDGTKISSTIKRITAPHSLKSQLSKGKPHECC
jgi:hypothetical protein